MSVWEDIYKDMTGKEIEDTVRKLAKAGKMDSMAWWSLSLKVYKLSEDFITEFQEYWNWTLITADERDWTEKFLIDNFKYIPWSFVIKNQKVVTPNFISHLRGKLSDSEWGDLIRMGKFNEDMIRYYRRHVPWRVVCTSMKLTEDFMREMQDYVDIATMIKSSNT